MTWTKILALSFVMVARTERVVEAITGRGDPAGARARRKPAPPAPSRAERQDRAAPPTITSMWANATVGATS